MRAQQVDPRDVQWESDQPTYRVVFWSGSAADEWDLHDALDVHEVVSWAEKAAHGRVYSVHVLAQGNAAMGALRLLGPAGRPDPSP